VAVSIHGHTLASLVGTLQSFRLAMPVVALMTREMLTCLNQLPCLLEGGWRDFGAMVQLTPEALAECRFWFRRLPAWNGFSLRPVTVSRVLYTDASARGFGGLIHRVLHRELEPAVQTMVEYWEVGFPAASVVTELEGLWRALVAGRAEMRGQVVLHRTDNMCTYYVVKNGGSQQSPTLTTIVRRIFVFCIQFGITLASQYVGAGVIITSGADALSRAADTSDCRLNKGVFQRLWHVFGPFEVDRFASANSVQRHPLTGQPLPYDSLFADSKCQGVDGLSADWRGVANYAFPPVSLVGAVLRLVQEQGAVALIILPHWPAQWWWPLAQELGKVVGMVALENLRSDGAMFEVVRQDGPCHPLGTYPHADSVEWLAVWVPGAAAR